MGSRDPSFVLRVPSKLIVELLLLLPALPRTVEVLIRIPRMLLAVQEVGKLKGV